MRKIVVSNNFFNEAAKALKQGQTVKLLIGGHSMYPFIRGGIDLVEVVPFSFEEELPAWCCPFYQWNGKYLIHRYIGKKGNEYMVLGDGNLARIERVKREDIIGILRTIYRPDGTVQDCRDTRWLKKAKWWYRLRFLRRWLLPVLVFTSGKVKISSVQHKK